MSSHDNLSKKNKKGYTLWRTEWMASAMGKKIFFAPSPNCITMSENAVCSFARATEVNGDEIAPPRVHGRQQTAQMFLQPAHEYYQHAVFLHLYGPNT